MSTNITFHPGSVDKDERVSLIGQRGVTVWLTGLSASGKSTIACALEQHLLHLHKFVYRLDGDNIRFGLNKDLGFDEKSRNENIRRIGEVSKLFTDAACVTITAFISPYRADRQVARDLHAAGGLPFVEVFVDAPLAVVEGRDPKGLYKKARAGEIKEFTGISAPYEAPENPELHIKTDETDVEGSVRIITEYLQKQGMPGPALQYGPEHYDPDEIVPYVQYTIIGNYLNYAIVCLLVYELLTSLDDEVQYVWPLKWRLPKILFMLNRYFIRGMLVWLRIVANYPGTTAEFCRVYSYWQMIPLRLAILAAQALVAIRVWAIYNNSRRMLYILSTLFLLEFIAITVCVIGGTMDTQGVAQPAPLSCGLRNPSGYLAAAYGSGTWIAPVCFEFILILITLFKLAPRWSFSSSQWLGSAGNKTMDVLARDSLIYFMFIFTFTLTNAVIYETDFTAYYHSVLLAPTGALSCIAVSRMMINLRSIPSPAESHDIEGVSCWNDFPLSQTYLGNRSVNAHQRRATPDNPYPIYEEEENGDGKSDNGDSDFGVAFSEVYGGSGHGLGNIPPDVERGPEDVGAAPASAVSASAKRPGSSGSSTRRNSLSVLAAALPPSPKGKPPSPQAEGRSSFASSSTSASMHGALPPPPPMLVPGEGVYDPPPLDHVYESGYEEGLRIARERRDRGPGHLGAGSATTWSGGRHDRVS
ncbi:hypothetical protein MKEN_00130100 [Mycena kentingensis (nom. inval.)]|nr:hypothetical protein MKEN_00130100 [Mycena kentingensis (nom. inval.)]